MGQKVYIWDLDGTLLDSYAVIVSSLRDAALEFGFQYDYEVIHKCVIQYSVGAFYDMVEKDHGLAPEALDQRYEVISKGRKMNIPPIDGAREALEGLKAKGARHFVYTHRGSTARPILDRLELTGYFDEIVTSENGFARKPAPDGIDYLVSKYGLNRVDCHYVGDRTIDMDCAKNAGITGILYLPAGSYCEANGSETRIVADLREI